MRRLVDRAKQPGFSADSWAPLAELVAGDEFERVGNFKEVMNWQEYVGFLTSWAPSADWECSFKRITEQSDVAFLELEERVKVGDFAMSPTRCRSTSSTVTARSGTSTSTCRWRHPKAKLLESYEGIQISE